MVYNFLFFAVVLLVILSTWLLIDRRKNKEIFPIQLLPPISNSNHVRSIQTASKILLTCSENGSQLAELEFFTLRKGEKLVHLPEGSDLSSFLEPLLQRIPCILEKGSEYLGFVYRVKFSPEITRNLLSGKSRFLKTLSGSLKATAVSANGTPLFQEGAEVIRTTGGPAALALLAWQLAAIITAQKYLVDINQKLKSIESQLVEILGLLQDQMFGNLKAYVYQLQVKFDTIKRGAISESELTSFVCFFDNLEHDCLSILETAKEQTNKSRERSITAASEEDKTSLLKECDTMDTYNSLWAAAAYTRLVAVQVKTLLPVDQITVSTLLGDMSTRLTDSSSGRSKFVREWRQKREGKQKLKRLPIFRTKHHRDVVKRLLRCNKLAKDKELSLHSFCNSIEMMLTAQAERLSRPLEIQVSIGANGAINDTQLIEMPTSD